VRYWLGVFVGHFIFLASVLLTIKHVAQVYTFGWVTVAGLHGASVPYAIAILAGAGLLYFTTILLWVAVFRLWRSWFYRLRHSE
jgi:hypothetical protein